MVCIRTIVRTATTNEVFDMIVLVANMVIVVTMVVNVARMRFDVLIGRSVITSYIFCIIELDADKIFLVRLIGDQIVKLISVFLGEVGVGKTIVSFVSRHKDSLVGDVS